MQSRSQTAFTPVKRTAAMAIAAALFLGALSALAFLRIANEIGRARSGSHQIIRRAPDREHAAQDSVVYSANGRGSPGLSGHAPRAKSGGLN